MPTYESACEKCGKNFDAFQSMRDEAFKQCPEASCRMKKWGRGKVKRLLGTGAGLNINGQTLVANGLAQNNKGTLTTSVTNSKQCYAGSEPETQDGTGTVTYINNLTRDNKE